MKIYVIYKSPQNISIFLILENTSTFIINKGYIITLNIQKSMMLVKPLT